MKKYFRLSILDLEKILETAKNQAQYHCGESFIDINITENTFEIEQLCVYRECFSNFYMSGKLKEY
jgi:hypothetical protein